MVLNLDTIVFFSSYLFLSVNYSFFTSNLAIPVSSYIRIGRYSFVVFFILRLYNQLRMKISFHVSSFRNFHVLINLFNNSRPLCSQKNAQTMNGVWKGRCAATKACKIQRIVSRLVQPDNVVASSSSLQVSAILTTHMPQHIDQRFFISAKESRNGSRRPSRPKVGPFRSLKSKAKQQLRNCFFTQNWGDIAEDRLDCQNRRPEDVSDFFLNRNYQYDLVFWEPFTPILAQISFVNDSHFIALVKIDSFVLNKIRYTATTAAWNS